MGRNGIEPPAYGFSDRRSTTELPKNINYKTVGRARLELTSSGHEPDMFPFTIPPLFI